MKKHPKRISLYICIKNYRSEKSISISDIFSYSKIGIVHHSFEKQQYMRGIRINRSLLLYNNSNS